MHVIPRKMAIIFKMKFSQVRCEEAGYLSSGLGFVTMRREFLRGIRGCIFGRVRCCGVGSFRLG